LFGSSNAHQALRKILVEDQKLDAVISMPSGVFRPYAGVSTAVLVFTKMHVIVSFEASFDFLAGFRSYHHMVSILGLHYEMCNNFKEVPKIR